MPEQISGVPRVLCRDQVDGLQNFQRPQGDIVQISNRRGNDVKHPGIIESELGLRHQNSRGGGGKRIRRGGSL
jgi:hypothetical protein